MGIKADSRVPADLDSETQLGIDPLLEMEINYATDDDDDGLQTLPGTLPHDATTTTTTTSTTTRKTTSTVTTPLFTFKSTTTRKIRTTSSSYTTRTTIMTIPPNWFNWSTGIPPAELTTPTSTTTIRTELGPLTPILVGITSFTILCIILFGVCYYKQKQGKEKSKYHQRDSNNSDTSYEMPYEDETYESPYEDAIYEQYNV